ncbi:MAG: dihydroorotate dehydrogenase electron transfer subunit [Eubacteriales bacterium]|nr:dihydroorotate dehydrogenase electron transfer subunit [Eubacteriales bacterium]
MSKKVKENAPIVSQECIGTDIYSMWLHTENIAREARPGQFVSLYSRSGDKLLPRPISICEIDKEKGRLRLVYRVTGKGTGTEEFSRLHAKVPVETLGPLGNGFPLEEVKGKKVFLMGGGIGIPPMLETAKQLEAEKTIILGYRDELFLKEEFEPYGAVFAATEDGSAGTKGNVMDVIREHALEAEAILACGPAPMLRAVKAYAEEKGILCYISMEERMACGVGACLACVCQSKDVDSHSHVHNKRVCKDGPVFLSTEVEL